MDGTPARRPASPVLEARALAIAAGGEVVQRDLSFSVRRGEVLAIAGPSGCGKSTLLRHLAGLDAPLAGQVLVDGLDLNTGSREDQAALRRRVGVMFQAGALWSSMSVGENLMLPLRLFTPLPRAERERQARFKLALVGLDGAFDRRPAELSGGMKKRAALARALVLDPELLLLDEPGSGLDPPNAARLDLLVAQSSRHLGTTVVMVTHTMDSVFSIADRLLLLHSDAGLPAAIGSPHELAAHGPAAVRHFLRQPGEDVR
jgi:phospholipid/cholesterol/gamma-HCH transport system ATP-binding protein